MKKLAKVLLVLLCMALLVAGSVVGTLAWLTAEKQVQNTFTVGKVEIELYETDMNPETGEKGTGKNFEGIEGIKIIPGRTISKDPTVTVKAGSEDCYVRAFMVVTWPNATMGKFDEQEHQDWMNFQAGWTVEFLGKRDNGDDTSSDIYELRYNTVVAKSDADQDLVIFDGIAFPGNLTSEQVASTEGSSVTVVAQAIQQEGFDTADLAWAEVETPAVAVIPANP